MNILVCGKSTDRIIAEQKIEVIEMLVDRYGNDEMPPFSYGLKDPMIRTCG